MSLEGLRAWIAEIERKLGKRTRVFLALAVIAIGLGGAAIYLAIDTRESAVSESDVQALQEDLEARLAGGDAAGGTNVSQLETELKALKAEVAALKSADGKSQGGKSGGSGSGGGSSGDGASGGGGASSGGASSGGASSGGAPSISPEDRTRAEELVEKFKQRQK